MIADQLESACRDVAAESDIRLLLQPAFTKAGPLRTRSEYSRGSLLMRDGLLRRGIAIPHPDDEVTHMNEQYGCVMLRLALDQLAVIGNLSGAPGRPGGGNTAALRRRRNRKNRPQQ